MIRMRDQGGRRVVRSSTILGALLLSSCIGRAIRIDELPEEWTLDVVLDASAYRHRPGRPIKFFVDITNPTPRRLDLSELEIELQAASVDVPAKVALRQQWSYRWPPTDAVSLQTGKKLSIPIVPERGIEFPLEQLVEGEYVITAVVNERHRSAPFKLAIERPDARVRYWDSTR